MNYDFIIRPLIGSGIGYITNWIAVKMLFRPINPIKLGKFTLPFTPGIIPKNKKRIAESIGKAISETLLTEESLQNNLLSEKKLDELKEKISQYIYKHSENHLTLKDGFSIYISEDIYNKSFIKIKNNLTKSIYNTVLEANLNELIADQIKFSVSNKLKGSMLGFFGGNTIVSSLTSNISSSLKQYITDNGEILISGMVEKELNKYTSKDIGSLSNELTASNIDIAQIILNIYEKIVIEKLSNILKSIDISNIVAEKITSMDTLELEKMILDIMKKELNSLVNLGALIGFILGLINLLF